MPTLIRNLSPGLHGLRSLWPIAVLLLLWQAVTLAGAVPPNLLPSPATIALRLGTQLQSGDFLFHILQTLIRLSSGFGIALVLGTVLGGMARSVRAHSHPLPAPCLLLSGGETTVTIRPGTPKGGRGGRNSECLLGLALALDAAPGVWALMGDTDGIDGSEDNAGAILAPDTLRRARDAGIDPRLALSSHDSYGLFATLGDTIVTGPTLTNVNDLRLVLVAPTDPEG